jgi:hypothetical protein
MDVEEDPYFVPEYFDWSVTLEVEGREYVEEKDEEGVKLESDPPLIQHTELWSGLLVGAD